MRCAACGRNDGTHCGHCHRAAEISTFGPSRAPVVIAPQVYGPVMEGFDPVAFRKRRIACGLTQAELARRAGVSPSLVNDYERERAEPRWANWKKLTAVLDAVE